MADVRGGKPVKLAVKGEAVLPAVDIKETKLDFGEVYTGVAARIPITIINTTPVLAGQSLIFLPTLYLALLHSCCCSSMLLHFVRQHFCQLWCFTGRVDRHSCMCHISIQLVLQGTACCTCGGVSMYRHGSGLASTAQLHFGPAQGELVA